MEGKFLLRVDIKAESDYQGIHVILKDAKVRSALVGFHTGRDNDNPHIHLVLDTRYTQETFRARLKKVWAIPKQFSLKKYDLVRYKEEEPYVYVFHEKNKESFICWWKNFSLKYDITRWAIQARPKVYEKSIKEEGSSKTKQPTFSEKLLDAALAELKPLGCLKTKVNCDGKLVPIGEEEIVTFIIRYFGKSRKVFDKFIIARMYNLIAWHMFGDRFEVHMRSLVHDVLQ